jgi:hypothetical protein
MSLLASCDSATKSAQKTDATASAPRPAEVTPDSGPPVKTDGSKGGGATPPAPEDTAEAQEGKARPSTISDQLLGPDAASATSSSGNRTERPVDGDTQHCCSALRLRAEADHTDTRVRYLKAAAICTAMVAQGKEKRSIVSAVEQAVETARLPAPCR